MWGKFCPVKVLDGYLSASGNDWLFPSLNLNLSPFNADSVSPSISSSQCLFENFHRRLQIQLDTAELRSRGVFLDRSDPNLQQQGRVRMLGANVKVSPAFIRSNYQCQHWSSVLQYNDPTTEALSVNHWLGVYSESDLQQGYVQRKQVLADFLLRRLADHHSCAGGIGMVADVSNLASMAAKLGAIYISQEGNTDLDPTQHPASHFPTTNYTNLGPTRSVIAQGLSPSLVKVRTAPKVIRKTKVAPVRKSHSLPSKVVNWDKDSFSQQPHTDQDSHSDPTPPLSVSPTETQITDGILSLQPLIQARSLSILKMSDSGPVALGQGVGVEPPHREAPSPKLPDGAASGERRYDIVSEDGVVSVTKVVVHTPHVPAPAPS